MSENIERTQSVQQNSGTIGLHSLNMTLKGNCFLILNECVSEKKEVIVALIFYELGCKLLTELPHVIILYDKLGNLYCNKTKINEINSYPQYGVIAPYRGYRIISFILFYHSNYYTSGIKKVKHVNKRDRNNKNPHWGRNDME